MNLNAAFLARCSGFGAGRGGALGIEANATAELLLCRRRASSLMMGMERSPVPSLKLCPGYDTCLTTLCRF